MKLLILLNLIVAIALNHIIKQITPILLTIILTIVFIYAGAYSFNAFNIQSIGSSIGIYSYLSQVSLISQFLNNFLNIIIFLIFLAWLLIYLILTLVSTALNIISEINIIYYIFFICLFLHKKKFLDVFFLITELNNLFSIVQ